MELQKPKCLRAGDTIATVSVSYGWGGIIIGKLKEKISFEEHGAVIKNIIGNEYGVKNLPVLYGLNFGHTSPMFILPYGAKAEINCESKSFTILESGVL